MAKWDVHNIFGLTNMWNRHTMQMTYLSFWMVVDEAKAEHLIEQGI